MTKRLLYRRPTLIVLPIVAALVVASQVWVLRGRVGTIEGGRLFRSAGIEPDRLVEVCQRYGVRTVVDLRTTGADAMAEAAILERAGIRHVSIPARQVPTPASIDAFLRVMDDPASGPVLVHCRHGVGRTGVFVAVYRMEYGGWSNRRATLEAWLYAGLGSFWPGSDKAAFLASYVPRRQRTPR